MANDEEEATVSKAAAKEFSGDAEVAALSLESDGISFFFLNKTALKAFLVKKDVSLLTDFNKSFAEKCCSSWFAREL